MKFKKFKSVEAEMEWVRDEWGFLVHYKDVGIIVAWDKKKTLYAWYSAGRSHYRLGEMELAQKPRSVAQARLFAHEWVELLAS